MALTFTRHIDALAVVYDCMDELSAFRGAPAALRENEAELMSRADLVFTGGVSLFETKRLLHPNVHAFPSSIDYEHFVQARSLSVEPDDQKDIPRPRLGFAGVIDERMDTALLEGIAAERPDWHIVLVGPVVKLDPAELPHRNNIHYLNARPYTELPAYLAGWDVALLPFARNESTRFISPTKTPEYLAAGRRVVSTSIRDVVRSYGDAGLVRIADSVEEFIRAVEDTIGEFYREPSDWLARIDAFLALSSWDKTWEEMMRLLDGVVEARGERSQAALPPNVVPESPLSAGPVPTRQAASGSEID
jgi:UDP-galactopyranose mutase